MMKKLAKRGLKAIWRMMEPLRRPVMRKLENFMRRCLVNSDPGLTDETNVLMDHVVRELVRLQCQVEALQQTILDLVPAQEGPAIAGEIEPGFTQQGPLKAG
jgi:hypothetical protein